MKEIDAHISWFQNYVAAEKQRETEDTGPMEMKYEHTLRVLANARTIVAQEAFDKVLGWAALLAALYHDIARFEQYRRYRTFKDRESVNHGRFGVHILKECGCLAREPARIRHLVCTAVGLHNRFLLPAHLDKDALVVTKVTRDADKLDILRVIDGHLASAHPYRSTVLLQLPDDPELASEAVISAALEDRVAAYADLRSVNDFRLLLATWINDMNFPASTAQFIAQGYARHIVMALPSTGVYASARERLLKRLTPLT